MAAENPSRVTILRTVESLRARVRDWRRSGETIAFVPTMGALHAGHISLVAEAKKHAARVVMSIFVNPTQFAPSEDFAAYPRSLEADAAKFEAAEGDALFAPGAEEMYPPNFATLINVSGPAVAGLEDKFRPTHFAGVATVVAKLLNQCRADVAVLGEKDYQQLKVVTQMARDLDFETAIVGALTARETDGLALSSRNVYLSAEERRAAPRLHAALARCAFEIREDAEIEPALRSARISIAEAGFVADYVEARNAETLQPVATCAAGPLRLLAAARLGKTRLIDNVAV